MNNNTPKRRFIRHCADLPIEIMMSSLVTHKKEYLNDIGQGGLSFKSQAPLANGTIIEIRIPLTRPVFCAQGKVVWCKKNIDYYDVGIEFVGNKDPFKIRMVEQICHIENYKREIREKEGRILTGEQAALEWIRKYADKFPRE
jgi:hypothetical protein